MVIIPFQALSVKIIMLIEISFYYTLVCVCEFPMFVDTKIEDYSEILNTFKDYHLDQQNGSYRWFIVTKISYY